MGSGVSEVRLMYTTWTMIAAMTLENELVREGKGSEVELPEAGHEKG